MLQGFNTERGFASGEETAALEKLQEACSDPAIVGLVYSVREGQWFVDTRLRSDPSSFRTLGMANADSIGLLRWYKVPQEIASQLSGAPVDSDELGEELS